MGQHKIEGASLTPQAWGMRKGAGGSVQRQLRNRGKFKHVSVTFSPVHVQTTEDGIETHFSHWEQNGKGRTFVKQEEQ